MYTLRDAIRERAYNNAKMEARWAREDAKREVEREKQMIIDSILRANPHIGILQRKGKHVYYTYPAGGKYTEAKHPSDLI